MAKATATTCKEQAARTRVMLVEAALDTLKTDGAGALTTVAVQRRAGVSRGALLHHFPTRHDLIRAVISRLVELNEAAVDQALAASDDDDARAFGPEISAHARFAEISAMAITFLRGLALSGLLRRSTRWADSLLQSWADTVTAELARPTI